MLEVNNFIMEQTEPFMDRADAGRRLAQALQHHAGRADLLVLALPRGGVPVAWPIAQALQAELDVVLVRKLGLPGQPEYAMGAIGSGGVRVLRPGILAQMGVTAHELDAVNTAESAELLRREQRYRGARPAARIAGRTVILVDDGIATGATSQAAIGVLRQQRPRHLVLAVPLAAPTALSLLGSAVDEVVCLAAPAQFRAVSQWYRRFGQTSDEEVQSLLAQAWALSRDAAGPINQEEPR